MGIPCLTLKVSRYEEVQTHVRCMDTWAPAREGGKSRLSPPPPLENQKLFVCYIGGLFTTFSQFEGILLRFSHYGGAFFTLWGPFCSMVGAFWACPPPPPLRKFLRTPMHGYIAHYTQSALTRYM